MQTMFEDFIGIWDDSIDEKLCRRLVKWFDWASEHKYTLSSEEEGMNSDLRNDESLQIPHNLNFSTDGNEVELLKAKNLFWVFGFF